MSDDKARDILGELEVRSPCGEGLADRVGQRGWSRPRVAVSPRLFRQYRVGDPWDPAATEGETPIGLGPVSLRLGEKKRQPAPHLKPREPKKAKLPSPPPAPRPSVPAAKTSSAPAPASQTPLGDGPDSQETARLAAAAAEKRRQAEAARGRPRRQPVAPASEPVAGQDGREPLRVPLPVRPEARDGVTDEVAQPESSKTESRKDSGGRFRMKPAASSRAPVVRDLPAEGSDDGEEAPPPKPRAAPPRPVGGGLDDLFAAAAQHGRLRVAAEAPEGAEE